MKEKIVKGTTVVLTAIFFVVATVVVMVLPYGIITLISTVLKGENEDE